MNINCFIMRTCFSGLDSILRLFFLASLLLLLGIDISGSNNLDNKNEFIFKNSTLQELSSRKGEDLQVVKQQEEINLTGTVVDQQGKPIPGVTVVVKGTNLGTITDGEGVFRLSVDAGAGELQFSFIGMKSENVKIDGRRNFHVVLEDAVKGLDEVVVVGYGIQKKSTLTGSVSSMQSKDITKGATPNLATTLSGRISGISAMQSGGGQPGVDDAELYLRGAATTNSSSPLIMIDGVPRDNLRTIDPDEVESISVLKDASATALFGVRGANGVIMVTTKRGEKGELDLNAKVEHSTTSFTREPERLNAMEYISLRNEASRNDGMEPAFDDIEIDRYRNPYKGLDPNAPDYEEKKKVRDFMYPDHDYYRQYISKNVPQTRVNINATGGTDKISFFINAGFMNQGGHLNTEPESVLGYDPSTKMDRYNFRTNVDYQVSPTFKTYLNIASYIEQVNMPSAALYPGGREQMMTDVFYQAQNILPITPGPTTIPGFGVDPGQIVDPLYLDRSAFEVINRMGYRNTVRSNLNTTLGIEWDLSDLLTEGLSVKGMFSYDNTSATTRQGEKKEKLYVANVDPVKNTLGFGVRREKEEPLQIVRGNDSQYNVNMQGRINYNRLISDVHDVGVMLLAQRDHWETTIGEIPYNVLGVAGRFKYNYDQRYFFEFNMGYNGSEQFSPDRRYGFFPAVSGGWTLSEEDFLNFPDFVTHLKFRASYGLVGNDQIGNERFLYMDNISMEPGRISEGGNPLYMPSLAQGQVIREGLLGNPDLSWETARKQNFGFDLQLMNDMNIKFDYFTENRTDILIDRQMIPIMQGVSLDNIPKVNLGEVDNEGFEVEFNYNRRINNDLTVGIRGNYNYNNNIVRYFDEPQREEDYAYRYRVTGHSLQQPWGYKVDFSNGNGFFNTQEELDNYLENTTYGFGGEPRLGDLKYVDLNNDGIIDDRDMAPVGHSGIPGVTYGLTFDVNYKGFDCSVFFQGVGNYSSLYSGQGVFEYYHQGTYRGIHKNAWTQERFENNENITYPSLSTQTNTNHVDNEFFIMDRSFTRLKNIETGYNIKNYDWLYNIGINDLRVYVGARNIYTWENFKLNFVDPENDSPLGYPVIKSIYGGLSLKF